VGPLGVPELIFIFVLALLIFGPRKLPELGRTLGRAMTEFRRASNELRTAVEDEMRELERQGQELKKTAEAAILPDDSGESVGAGTIHPSGAAPAEPPRYEEKPPDEPQSA
jgi:sec-independent protein translocase protein TatA